MSEATDLEIEGRGKIKRQGEEGRSRGRFSRKLE